MRNRVQDSMFAKQHGDQFEKALEALHDRYARDGKARIYKMNNTTRFYDGALHFSRREGADYTGDVRMIPVVTAMADDRFRIITFLPVCLEAKWCEDGKLDISLRENTRGLKKHQALALSQEHAFGKVAFVLVGYPDRCGSHHFVAIPWPILDAAIKRGEKSIDVSGDECVFLLPSSLVSISYKGKRMTVLAPDWLPFVLTGVSGRPAV